MCVVKLFESYKKPEGRAALWFLKTFAVFYAFLFLLTFLLRNCGGLTDNWPVGVWHVLNVGINYIVVGLVAFALTVLFLVPLWYFGRRGKESGEESFEAAKNTMVLVLLVTLFSSFFIFQTIGTIDDRDVTDRIRHYETHEDVNERELRLFMIPRSATDIKVYADQGIGYRTCDISCTVGMDGLLVFARENGYRFERRERIPGFAKSCVTQELDIDPSNITNYLYSAVGVGDDKVRRDGRSGFGGVSFVYDVANKRLYGSYGN